MSFTLDKDSLFGDEELNVMVTYSGFIDGETIFIKGAFYQENSTNYFGLTKKDDSWIKNGDDTVKQRQIVVGQWNKNVIVKSDFSDSGFKGEGEYKLKIGYYYYTSPEKLSSVNWASTSATILLNAPDPTPTNTPIPTVANTPTSTPTHTPILTPIPTPSCTVKPTSFVRVISEVTMSEGMSASGSVLGSGVSLEESTPAVSMLAEKRPYIIALVSTAIGLALIAAVSVIKIRYTR